jgi:hypothetical protein
MGIRKGLIRYNILFYQYLLVLRFMAYPLLKIIMNIKLLNERKEIRL